MQNWTRIGDLNQFPAKAARVVTTDQGDIAVFRTGDDRLFAIADRCPHKGGPLSQGIVFGDKVACPLHNWTIDLATGEAIAPDEGCAGRFEVKVEDGNVYLGLGNFES